MTPKRFREARILFKLSPCSHCRLLSFVALLNQKMHIYKNIEIIDCTTYRNTGIITDMRQLEFQKMYDGYPTLFFDGIKINGSNSEVESYAEIFTLASKDFIIPEQNPFKYENTCNIIKKGLFRGHVQCQD